MPSGGATGKTGAMTPPLDKRLTLALPHVADALLKGVVDADRYVTPERRYLDQGDAVLHREPGGVADSELLYGERFDVLDTRPDGWMFGQCAHDGYVGWLQARLTASRPSATHRVISAGTHAYRGASVRAEIVHTLSPGARLVVPSPPVTQKRWLQIRGELWVPQAHLTVVDQFETDPVSVAERCLHAPYRWGGRSRRGYDCSGLVQVALMACGVDCPRDTDQQCAALGEEINPADGLKRGDLVFWDGHVGFMQSPTHLIHANGYHMATTSEPLAEAVQRIGETYGPVTAHKRGAWAA